MLQSKRDHQFLSSALARTVLRSKGRQNGQNLPLKRARSWRDVVNILGFERGEDVDDSQVDLVASVMYSFPMTIAHYLKKLLRDDEISPLCGEGARDACIFVVGARAESTMPHELWGILKDAFPALSFQIHLIGPQVNAAAHSALVRTSRRVEGISIMAWKQPFERFWGENENKGCSMLQPDLVVLFNPGLGHSIQGKDWALGFRSIAGLGAPILITSFDKVDHDGDLKFVETRSKVAARWVYRFEDNPFKNLKHEMHNQDHGRVINTNAYASVLTAGV